MARFKRLKVLQKMHEIGMIPVFYNGNFDIASQIIAACAAGGAQVIEFTNRGDFAADLFGELEKFVIKNFPDVILGVGSIVDPYTAAIYLQKGANFIVGPALNSEVARLCNRHKIPYSPGCGTVTEIQQAEELGCEIIKVFPGGLVGGPAFVKAVKGPMPWSDIMPTGGVSTDKASLTEWFRAGTVCVGIGSKLISKDIINKKAWDSLKLNTSDIIAIIKDIKSKG